MVSPGRFFGKMDESSETDNLSFA